MKKTKLKRAKLVNSEPSALEIEKNRRELEQLLSRMVWNIPNKKSA